MINDINGTVSQYIEYIPYGEEMYSAHHNTYNSPYRYTAKELDEETGLYYYGARYYNPKLSIWLSVDPMMEKYISLSPYNYVMNNPIKYIDPDGREIVDSDGNKQDIQVKDNKLVYGENVSIETQTVLNEMWKTETGQEQVNHLLKTKAAIKLVVSENIGVYIENGKYYAVYGSTGPDSDQSKKLIKDYDGKKVYKENTITLYLGTYEYGIGDDTKLKEGKISVIDPKNGKDVSSEHKGKVKLEPSQNPDMIYKTLTEFYNLTGVHETEHTKSANIKLQRRRRDSETPAYDKEDKSKKELNK